MEGKVMLHVLRDNKLCEEFPSETRYFLTIVKDDFITLVEEHLHAIDIPARVVDVELDPLEVLCKNTLSDNSFFKLGFAQIQQIAYRNCWYEKVAKLVLTHN
jgi:hypothetical protein